MDVFYSQLTPTDLSFPAFAGMSRSDNDGVRILESHKNVWQLFGDHPDRKADFIWRDMGSCYLSISAREPVDSQSLFKVTTKPYAPFFIEGDLLRFSLRANATVGTKNPRDLKARGHRECIITRALRELRATHPNAKPSMRDQCVQDAALKWFGNKAANGGFSVVREKFSLNETNFVKIPRDNDSVMPFGVIDISGYIHVTDPVLLVKTLTTGIGHAKRFGCGLMMVA